MGKPSTKSLVSGNDQLSKPRIPENYAYYKLADKLRISLEMILSQAGNPPSSSGKIKIYEKQLPEDISSYLRHTQGEVAYAECQNLVDLLYELIEYVLSESKTPFSWLDLEVIRSLNRTHNYKTKPFKWRVVRDFWLRARSCTELAGSVPKEHTGLKLLDLISACSGYRNFADFLQKEFGDDYDPEKDETLQALIASAAKQASLVSTKQSLIGTFIANLKTAAHKFSKTKGGKKKSLKQAKARSEKPEIFGFLSKGSIGKAISFMPILLLISLVGLGIFMFTGRTKEAQVNVTLTTRYLHFQTDQATTLRSPDRLMLGSQHHFSIRNAVYTLDYPFSDTSPVSMRIKPLHRELVGIEHIKLPDDAKVTIETPTQKDMYIGFYESEGLNGFIPIDHSIVFSPEEMDSVIYGQNPTGTGINFQSNKGERSDISLIDAADFEWPPFYVKSISFGELKQDQVEYGIESAQIDFLKSEKSIQLKPKDLLGIAFTNPIKLLVKYQEGLVSLQFTGVVNSIYAGPEIYGKSSSNNQMPKLWEEHKELLGIVVIILVLVFPAIVMYKSRTRQPI